MASGLGPLWHSCACEPTCLCIYVFLGSLLPRFGFFSCLVALPCYLLLIYLFYFLEVCSLFNVTESVNQREGEEQGDVWKRESLLDYSVWGKMYLQ